TGREGLCRKPWACTGEADQTSAIPSTKRQDRRKTVILRKSVSFKKPGERIGRGVNRKAVRSSRDAGRTFHLAPRGETQRESRPNIERKGGANPSKGRSAPGFRERKRAFPKRKRPIRGETQGH